LAGTFAVLKRGITAVKSIALIGFMGTGKSTIGPLLARRLGFAFVETDDLIEKIAGKSIARIFAEDGEAAFRRLERSVIQRVTLLTDAVISCGGGATIDPRNLRLLRMSCRVVLLKADPLVLFERIARCESRPIARRISEVADVERILEDRARAYSSYDFCVDTGRCTESQAVDLIVEWLLGQDSEDRSLRLSVGLDKRSYSIAVGFGLLSHLGSEMRDVGLSGRALLFSNDTVADLYGERVLGAMSRAGFECYKFLMADGESYKNLETAQQAYVECSRARLERRSTIVALGGGVVGDVAGFVAGTYMRGVNLVQVPTTLLAMVDSSVGGKTAVNMPFGKNMVGVFYQPRLVVADLQTLSTLPARDYRSGMVELVKHGLILNPALLEYLLERPQLLSGFGESEDLAYAVAHSCAVKAEVVESDELDFDFREILNVGHTIGHALELVCGYGRLKHGEAVALGIIAETLAANMSGLASDECLEKVRECLYPLLEGLVLPDVDASAVYEALLSDKKRRDGRVRFSVLEQVGRVRLGVELARSAIEEAIANTVSLL